MSITIGLDAGHGGSSSGTYSVNTTKDGLFEEHYTLDLCKRVGKILNEHGVKTVLTRTTDTNPGTVSQRAQMLVNAKCDYAVSLHFNGHNTESANGCEVFVPYGEKGAGIEAGYYKYLGKFFKLRDPFARCYEYPGKTIVFDKKLNTSTRKFDAYSTTKQNYFGFIRTAWQAGLSADLLEVCFLTNKKDFETYTKNIDAIAEAIARSILEGYKIEWKPKEAVKPAELPKENGKYFIAFNKKEKAEAFADSVGAFVAEI
jgi:N-acetylmuramoyl-L-alanine amidase